MVNYNKKDVSVTYEDNQLKIESVKSKDEKEVEDNEGILHKISQKRVLSLKTFTVADDVEVKSAELKDGLLRVSLGKNYSRTQKAKTISLSNSLVIEYATTSIDIVITNRI